MAVSKETIWFQKKKSVDLARLCVHKLPWFRTAAPQRHHKHNINVEKTSDFALFLGNIRPSVYSTFCALTVTANNIVIYQGPQKLYPAHVAGQLKIRPFIRRFVCADSALNK